MHNAAQARTGFLYNGIHYVSWAPEEYESARASTALDNLATTNANWSGVLVTRYQANASASSIYADPQKTPTDAALTHAINDLHNRGLKVMLKPHVDASDGSWRGVFNPSDIDAWFTNYTAFIMHYAELAQILAVEGMVIGTEFTQISSAANQARWYSVIDRVRPVFTGVLSYAANATHADDEFTQVSFWDALDVVGLNGYFPLTNHGNPTLAELVSAWHGNQNGENLAQIIQSFAAAVNRPLIFTEVGYRSVTGANAAPWNFQLAAPCNPTEQANCYEAFFEIWSAQSSWMQGAFWWDWAISGPSAADTDYTPRGKPAAQVLASWYATETGA